MGPLSEPSGEAAVDVRDLSFSYGGRRPALSGVTLRARAGEVVAVLGPNGSGKTTLLRILSGRIGPGSGRVRVLGSTPPLPPAILRRTGHAGADPVHREVLTGRENVLFFARACGLPPTPAARSTDDLLELVGLGAAGDAPVSEYSRGMKRKLLLVESLVHAPDLLLLDEPFGGLDPPTTETLIRELGARARKGVTVLLATHALGRVPDLAGRVVFLHEGRVVADDTPDELLAGLRERCRAELLVRPSGSGDPPQLHAPFRIEEDGGPDPDGLMSLRVSWPREWADVSTLVRLLTDGGATVRELRVVEPDLSGVFRRLTGRSLRRRDGHEPQ